MAKQSLLLVDADPQSARVLEVSLRKAGYSVTHAEDADMAFSHADMAPPDLILSDTRLAKVDGFQLLARLRAHPTLREVPFMFLSSDTDMDSKRRGLELGVEYLTKPLYLREVITRVALELQRHERRAVELGANWSSHMSGSLSEMGVVDLLQLIERGEKDGVLHVHSGTDRADIYFVEGQVVDAEFGPKRGAPALYRAMTWSEGLFDLEFSQNERTQTIDEGMQGLLMEGMRRLDEWGRMLEQLPPLEQVFEVDGTALAERLSELPDRINGILRHINGSQTLIGVVDASGWDDLEALETISKLYFEGMIVPVATAADDTPKVAERVSAAPDKRLSNHNQTLAPAGIAPAMGQETASGIDAPHEVTTPGTQLPPYLIPERQAAVARPPRRTPIDSPSKRKGRRKRLARERQRHREGGASRDPLPATGTESQVAAEATKESGTNKADAPRKRTPVAEPVSSAGSQPPGQLSNVIPFPSSAPVAIAGHVAVSDPSSTAHATAVSEPEQTAPTTATAEATREAKNSSDENSQNGHDGTHPYESAGKQDDPAVQAADADQDQQHEDQQHEDQQHEDQQHEDQQHEDQQHEDQQHEDQQHEDQQHEDQQHEDQQDAELADSDDAHQVTHFFTSDPPEEWEDLEPAGEHDDAARRWRNVTLGMAAGAAVLLIAWLGYSSLFAVQPDPDVGAAHIQLPPPLPAERPAVVPTEVPPESPNVATIIANNGPPAAAPSPQPDGSNATLATLGEADEPPSDGAYRNKIAEAEQLRGQAAVTAYEQALVLNPNGVEALTSLAFADMEARRFELAVSRAERATSLDPTSSKAWVVLGYAWQSLREPGKARDAYRACVELGTGEYVRHCRTMVR